MNFYALSGLINGLTATILGIFVVVRNRRGIKNITYGLFCLFVSIWGYFYFVWQTALDRSVALFCSRGFMAGAIFIPVCYLHHLFIFFDIYNQKKKLIFYGYLGGVIFSLLNFTPLFIKDVSPKMIFKFWPEPGILYHPFLILWFWYVLYGIYIIISEHKKSSGLRRNQSRYMLLATSIGWSGGATNYFLWYDIPILPFGNIFVSIYMAITAYIIIRYHLMDITIAIKKTTLLACGVLLPTAGVVIGINLLQPKLTKIMGESWWLVPSGITVILTLILFRFVNYVIRLKDEELNKSIKHYRNQLRTHTEQLAKSKTTRELVSYTVRHISTIAKLDFCAVALKKEEIIEDEIIIKKRKFYIIEGVSDRTGRELSKKL